MDKQITFQLERWTGREYVPHGAPHVTDNPHTAGNVADTARMLGLPAWRLVRVDKARPAKVTRWRPVASRASGRSVRKVQEQYMEWARSRLEIVTCYATWGGGADEFRAHGFGVRLVDPAEFIGPAPAAELIEEGE